MKAIEVLNLTKAYGDTVAVDGINLNVNEGTALGLLGVNGAGKTTTIKMLTGITKPDSGDALLLGKSIVKEPETVKKFINVSPQETAVAPNLSVRENLEFICGIYGLTKSEAKERAVECIKEFGLGEIEKKRASTLSGGWQRRLSIAMAVITKPNIVFLDEPTLGLDVLARRELWHTVEKLKEKTAIVLTTHYLEEAEALCDKIAIMNHGKIVAFGSVQELIEKSGKENFESAFVYFCEGGDRK